jgi:hypothetical protein
MGLEVLVKFVIICIFCVVALMLAYPPTPAPDRLRTVAAGILLAIAIVFVPLIPFR